MTSHVEFNYVKKSFILYVLDLLNVEFTSYFLPTNYFIELYCTPLQSSLIQAPVWLASSHIDVAHTSSHHCCTFPSEMGWSALHTVFKVHVYHIHKYNNENCLCICSQFHFKKCGLPRGKRMFKYLIMPFTRSLQGIYITISCAAHPGGWDLTPLVSSNAPFFGLSEFESSQMARSSSLAMSGSGADTSLPSTSFSPLTSEAHKQFLLAACLVKPLLLMLSVQRCFPAHTCQPSLLLRCFVCLASPSAFTRLECHVHASLPAPLSGSSTFLCFYYFSSSHLF